MKKERKQNSKQKKKGNSKIFFFITLAVWIGLFFIDGDSFFRAWAIFRSFILEMLQILPFVLVLSALVTEWIPSETVKRHLGKDSRFKGALFAYLLGSLSAGPIYAAFPVCLSLKKKGASVRNLTILISTWAVIKIPMLFMELKSLGPRFTLIRYCLTVPIIFLLGFLMDRFVKVEAMTGEMEEDQVTFLPGKDCGACGFGTCGDLYKALQGDKVAMTDKCIFLKE